MGKRKCSAMKPSSEADEASLMTKNYDLARKLSETEEKYAEKVKERDELYKAQLNEKRKTRALTRILNDISQDAQTALTQVLGLSNALIRILEKRQEFPSESSGEQTINMPRLRLMRISEQLLQVKKNQAISSSSKTVPLQEIDEYALNGTEAEPKETESNAPIAGLRGLLQCHMEKEHGKEIQSLQQKTPQRTLQDENDGIGTNKAPLQIANVCSAGDNFDAGTSAGLNEAASVKTSSDAMANAQFSPRVLLRRLDSSKPAAARNRVVKRKRTRIV